MENKIDISFIIPALNEEENIGRTINSVRSVLNIINAITYEIIIADNGSEDQTLEICQQKDVQTVEKKNVNIGSLRNLGSEISSGEILIFIDADVCLTEEWGKHFPSVIESLKKNSYQVYGSKVQYPPINASILEKVWFHEESKQGGAVNYINSGHLIVSKFLFNKLNGFDGLLVSGEDSDFSQRALAIGAKLISMAELKVIHYGYPKNVKEFFNRERWHGYGDFQSISFFLKSKPAIISSLNIIFFIIVVVLSITIKWWYFPIYFFGLLVLSFLSALYKNKMIFNNRIWFLTYFYIYYISARSMSLLDRFFSLASKRWR